jgi:hypothetical protein
MKHISIMTGSLPYAVPAGGQAGGAAAARMAGSHLVDSGFRILITSDFPIFMNYYSSEIYIVIADCFQKPKDII